MMLANFLGVYSQYKLFGSNIFITLPYLLGVLLIVISTFHGKYARNYVLLCSLLIVFFFLILINLFKLHFYQYVISLMDARFVFSLIYGAFIYLSLTKFIPTSEIKILALISIVLMSLFQLAGYIVVPNIEIIKDENNLSKVIFNGNRTRDGLLGSSFTAYHCVIGVILSPQVTKRLWVLTLLLLLFVVTTLYSQTRIALVFELIFIIWYYFYGLVNYKKKYYFLFLLFALMCTIIYFGSEIVSDNIISQVVNRFDINLSEDARIIKTQLTLKLISDSWAGMLLGVDKAIVSSETLKGYTVSDNSLFLIQLKFGIFLLIVFLTSHIILLRYYFYIPKTIILWFPISFVMTNSILWDSLMIVSVLTLVPRQTKLCYKDTGRCTQLTNIQVNSK